MMDLRRLKSHHLKTYTHFAKSCLPLRPVRAIDYGAFEEFLGLRTVILNDGLDVLIGWVAFYGCSSLEDETTIDIAVTPSPSLEEAWRTTASAPVANSHIPQPPEGKRCPWTRSRSGVSRTLQREAMARPMKKNKTRANKAYNHHDHDKSSTQIQITKNGEPQTIVM